MAGNVSEMIELARLGKSVEVNAYDFTDDELVNIAMALQRGAYLKINNSASRSSTELSRIASATPGRIIVA